MTAGWSNYTGHRDLVETLHFLTVEQMTSARPQQTDLDNLDKEGHPL